MAHASHHTRTGRGVVVHIQGRQRANLQKRRAGVQQHFYTIAGQQFAAGQVLGTWAFAATQGDLRQLGLQVLHQGQHGLLTSLEGLAAWVDL